MGIEIKYWSEPSSTSILCVCELEAKSLERLIVYASRECFDKPVHLAQACQSTPCFHMQ